MTKSCTAQETRQKQLGRINTTVGPYDKNHPNLGVGIPTNVPGRELHWAPERKLDSVFLDYFFPNNFAIASFFRVLQKFLLLFS